MGNIADDALGNVEGPVVNESCRRAHNVASIDAE
jgi:hypothetical protein